MAHDPSPCNLARLREAHSATLTLAAGQAVGHKGTRPATEPCTLCLCLGPTLPVLKCHRGSTVSPLPILCPSRSGAQEESPTKPSQGSTQTQGTEPQNLRAPGLWLKGWGAGQSLGAGTCASVRVFACARVCLCVCAHAQGECARCSALKHLPGHNSPPRLPHPPAPAPPVLSSEGWSACCPGRFLLSQSGYPLAAAWLREASCRPPRDSGEPGQPLGRGPGRGPCQESQTHCQAGASRLLVEPWGGPWHGHWGRGRGQDRPQGLGCGVGAQESPRRRGARGTPGPLGTPADSGTGPSRPLSTPAGCGRGVGEGSGSGGGWEPGLPCLVSPGSDFWGVGGTGRGTVPRALACGGWGGKWAGGRDRWKKDTCHRSLGTWEPSWPGRLQTTLIPQEEVGRGEGASGGQGSLRPAGGLASS